MLLKKSPIMEPAMSALSIIVLTVLRIMSVDNASTTSHLTQMILHANVMKIKLCITISATLVIAH